MPKRKIVADRNRFVARCSSGSEMYIEKNIVAATKQVMIPVKLKKANRKNRIAANNG